VGGEDGFLHLFDVAAGGALTAAGVSDKNMSAYHLPLSPWCVQQHPHCRLVLLQRAR
jgi:hypothetical protein